MNFVSMSLTATKLIDLLRRFPEKWHKEVYGDLQSLIGFMHGRTERVLLDYTNRVSVGLGRGYVRKILGDKASGYVNALLDCETQTLSIKIPVGESGMDFYSISIREAGLVPPLGAPNRKKLFELELFHPTLDGCRWFGCLSAALTYWLDMGDEKVTVDGERISIRAWNAICAHSVALKTEAYTLLWDMARDGEM